jgi:NAD(P)-dependent dehydrogenase (short-subunit alcohol dehydrogenase family)
MEGLSGKTAIVTGGASGLGAGLVAAFAAAGVKVMSADISDGEGQRIADQLGAGCAFRRTDLRDDAAIDALVADAEGRFGGIDFLVNAACTYEEQGLESDRDAWRNGFDVNVFGHVELLRRALPHLKKSASPSVVFFVSTSGNVAQSGRWVYPATKAALDQVTRSAALDLAEFGIRVNSVLPGWAEKPWQQTAPDAVKEHYRTWGARLHMLGRQGAMREITDAVLFLCSEHAGFMTGACLRVDGGQGAMGPQGRERILPAAVRDTGQKE